MERDLLNVIILFLKNSLSQTHRETSSLETCRMLYRQQVLIGFPDVMCHTTLKNPAGGRIWSRSSGTERENPPIRSLVTALQLAKVLACLS